MSCTCTRSAAYSRFVLLPMLTWGRTVKLAGSVQSSAIRSVLQSVLAESIISKLEIVYAEVWEWVDRH